MGRSKILFYCILLVLGVFLYKMPDANATEVPRMDKDTLKDMLDSRDLLLIDVRLDWDTSTNENKRSYPIRSQ